MGVTHSASPPPRLRPGEAWVVTSEASVLRTEAAKDRDQGEPDAKEKGERRRVRRLCCESHGPSLVCEIINITGDGRVLSASWGKGEKLSTLL